MPYAHEIAHKLLPPSLDRRRKLTDEDREAIRASTDSARALAAAYGVSRRLIGFIRNPDKRAANYALRVANGGSKQYYDPDTHRVAIRETRRHRQRNRDALLDNPHQRKCAPPAVENDQTPGEGNAQATPGEGNAQAQK